MKWLILAYIGCLSGAEMKDKYIELINQAGFQEVKIIEETTLAVEYMINDPTAKAIIENFNIPVEKVKEIANSVASVKVYGIKPQK